MNDPQQGFSKLGFVNTFVLPALLIFLVPIVSLFFFQHAQDSYDAQMRAGVLKQVGADATLSAQDRQQAIAFFTEHPFSELLKNAQFAGLADRTTRFYYLSFRWCLALSVFSIVSGIAVLALTAVCVWASRSSQQAQYVSLSVGWQVLRIYGALQTVVQGLLVLALSFWVTALWFHFYSVKLIGMVGILALLGAGAVIVAIFKRPDTNHAVEGKVIDRTASPGLWNELNRICEQVGTVPPDQVVVGIDDNFFVTEMPITVSGTTYEGRTLYVSLSLLKQMYGAEADAVLAHEMAHFSGNDTMYTKKVAPLLTRYNIYLQSLYQNVLARPVFYFIQCFRALFELSLAEQSRNREFRADRIASEVTSPQSLAGALLRVAAYSNFRGSIQEELFKQERALESANILTQIEEGFHRHAVAFAAKSDLASLATSHPFDTHPPLGQRFENVGMQVESAAVHSLVATPGDGRWYEMIEDAEQVERQQWSEFEDRFRAFHEQALAYRFLPETEEEREIVVKAFPGTIIDGKRGSLILDYESLRFADWPDSVAFCEITNIVLKDNKLLVQYERDGKQKVKIPMTSFGKAKNDALAAVQHYYGRYLAAKAYQAQKQEESIQEQGSLAI